MNPSRRELLKAGLGATVIGCGSPLPSFVRQAAAAVDLPRPPERILVVVELDGGNDGLNTVVPYTNDVYRRSRPTLQIPAGEVLRIDDQIGLHPRLQGFSKLLQDQQLAIVQSVGYPNPNRSHFESMSIWHTGDRDATLSTNGWLSQFIDARSRPGQLDSVALHVDDAVLPQALKGSDFQVPSADQIEQLQRRIGVPSSADPIHHLANLDRVIAQQRGTPESHLRFIQENAAISYASSARLSNLLKHARRPDGSYPSGGLAQRLRMISQLIRAELGTVIYYTRLGGFDTHIEQRFAHANLLSQLGDSAKVFFDDLGSAGIADKVMMFVFSEFGRRLAENGAKGTDHGTAGPVFLIGPTVNPGLHGPVPNLDDLVDGDPKYAVDFRNVYSQLLSQWIGHTQSFEGYQRLPSIDPIQT